MPETTTLPNGGTFDDENIENAIDLTPPFSFTVASAKPKRGNAAAFLLLGAAGVAGFISRRAKAGRLG